MLIGISFHYVRPSFESPFPGIFGLTPDAMRAQLELLGRFGVFVGQDDLRRTLAGEACLPENGWIVTFDDGLREQYEHALPVLDAMGIPAVFFANTLPLAERRLALVHMTHLLRSQVAPVVLGEAIVDIAGKLGIPLGEVDGERAVTQYRYDTTEMAQLKYLLNFALPVKDRERVVDACFDRLLGWNREQVCQEFYMGREQLKVLASRDMLGSHSHSHRPLGTLDAAQIRREISVSLDYLEEWTGVRVDSLAYPYGSREACSHQVGEIAASLNIAMGFTMERAGIDSNSSKLFLPRCAPNDLPGGRLPCWPDAEVFGRIPASSWYLLPAL
jgi:peptidoglycan/xylan/chitin deacetylase (PgdA/CDA1 family)